MANLVLQAALSVSVSLTGASGAVTLQPDASPITLALQYGLKGDKGADGAPGADGRQGVDGAQGPQGPAGPSIPAADNTTDIGSAAARWANAYFGGKVTLGSLLAYNLQVDAANYERATFDWTTSANTLTIGAQAAGTGTLRNVNFVGANLNFNAGGATQLSVLSAPGSVNFFQFSGSTSTHSVALNAAGADVTIPIAYATKGGASHLFRSGGGTDTQFEVAATVGAVNWVQTAGSLTGVSAGLQVVGADASINLALSSKGTGSLFFRTRSTSVTQFAVLDTVSAVNYLSATGGATGVGASLASNGSDAVVNMLYSAKGAAQHQFRTNGANGNIQFVVADAASAVNWLQASGGATGAVVPLTAVGADGSISIQVLPKGTGVLLVGGSNGSATVKAYSALLGNSAASTAVNAPLINGTQTWNAAGVTFTGMLLNITDTASAAASLLWDMQVGGVSKFSVDKTGALFPHANIWMPAGSVVDFSGRGQITFSGVSIANIKGANGASVLSRLQFGSTGTNAPCLAFVGTTMKVQLADLSADAPLTAGAFTGSDVLTLVNGVTPMSVKVYNTFTDVSNYERGAASWNSNVFEVGPEAAGTGTLRTLRLKGAWIDLGGAVNLAGVPTLAGIQGSPGGNGGIAFTANSNPQGWFSGVDFRVHSAGYFAWSGSSTTAVAGRDTALARNAAGVVEINNGTALGSGGTLGDLTVRNLLATGAVKLNGKQLPYVLAQAAVPIIVPSSGSSNGTGQITMTTALPYVPSGTVQVCLPAGVVVGDATGGLYSATFSSTTVCQLAGSPVTANAAYTQRLTSYTAVTVAVPGGTMGANGALQYDVHFTGPNNANAKSWAILYGGQSQAVGGNFTTGLGGGVEGKTVNRNNTSAQVGYSLGAYGGSGGGGAVSYGSVDSTVAQNFTITVNLAAATDYMILEAYGLTAIPG